MPRLTAVLQHTSTGAAFDFRPDGRNDIVWQLRGALQANYALLVTQEGGELIELPKLPAS